ncbi:hypothetical protein SDC9_156073 [bioreactor metagenome]|uniref:Uncharacterized protein n=1 Tax=bioreactor metagenome TaxID=1076179 RepID=A0A645F388_9ZZZZ
MPIAVMQQVTGIVVLAAVHVADDAARVFFEFVVERGEVGRLVGVGGPQRASMGQQQRAGEQEISAFHRSVRSAQGKHEATWLTVEIVGIWGADRSVILAIEDVVDCKRERIMPVDLVGNTSVDHRVAAIDDFVAPAARALRLVLSEDAEADAEAGERAVLVEAVVAPQLELVLRGLD